MRRTALTVAICLVPMLVPVVPASATPDSGAAQGCVGGTGCFGTVQAAIDAAQPGSTIRINPGTYAGGVTVGKSLRLVGAGPELTVLRGGGPVLTITSTASDRPDVSVSGLTVTGGVTKDSPIAPFLAFGGGIFIRPPTGGPAPGEAPLGATVTLENVHVTGNRAAAETTVPSGAPCPDGDCPFAASLGAGVANFGNLLIRNSVIADNSALGHVSDTEGGGIWSKFGDLRIESSQIVGNRSVPAANDIGLYAEGGGVFVGSGNFTLLSSKVNGNIADLTTAYPTLDNGDTIEMQALGGALHLDGADAVRIEDSEINDNVTRATDPNSDANAWGVVMGSAGGGNVIRRTVMNRNTLSVTVPRLGASGPVGPLLQFGDDSTLSDTAMMNNTTDVRTTTGPALSIGTLGFVGYRSELPPSSLTRVMVRGNTVSAVSQQGTALITGAGVFNQGPALQILDSLVQGNVGTADGTQATALGGGIWNGQGAPSDPAPQLTISGTRIVANTMITTPSGGAQGGGIYTTLPIQLDSTVVAGNAPDACVGCPPTVGPPTLTPDAPGLAIGRRHQADHATPMLRF